MLIGMLAVSGLGMALWSSKKEEEPDSTQSMREYLQIGTDTPRLESSDTDVPSMFFIFEIAMDVYTVEVDEGYLVASYESKEEAIDDAEVRSTEREGTHEINVVHYRDVPFDIAQRLLSEENDFSDGYEAQDHARKARSRNYLWSWNMYNQPFSEWDEDAQHSERENAVRESKEKVLKIGSLVYVRTNTVDRWELESTPIDYGFSVTTSKDKAADWPIMMEESHLSKTKGPDRIVTLKVLQSMSFHIVEEKEWFEEIFETDFSDVESTAEAIEKYDEIETGFWIPDQEVAILTDPRFEPYGESPEDGDEFEVVNVELL